MMYDHEKSDFAIVAGKPTNKAGATAAVEPRAGTERNADEQSTHRTLSRARVTQARGRVRQIDAVSYSRGRRSYGAGGEVVAPSSSLRTDGVAPWPKLMISAEA